MFGQTFSVTDIPLLFFLIGLEIVLSSDNLIAISLIAQKLPLLKRKRAIWTGFLSAIFLRAVIVLGASFLIDLIWIKILGALYLVFLSLKYFFTTSKAPKEAYEISFLKGVIYISFTDLIFALDSILAAVALIGIPHHYVGLYPKLWIVYFGGIIGATFIRFSAIWVSKLIDIFPRLGFAAHFIIGWVGIKLFSETFFSFLDLSTLWLPWAFWGIFILALGWGFTRRSKN